MTPHVRRRRPCRALRFSALRVAHFASLFSIADVVFNLVALTLIATVMGIALLQWIGAAP